MSQRKKNIRQLIYLAVLLSLTAFAALIRRGSNGFDYDRNKFTLDQNKVITTVILTGKDFENRFEYLNGDWQVNDRYLLDQGMRDVFFALLSRVEVQRPVSDSERDSLAQYLKNFGVKVTILNNADTIKSYLAGGNENRFQSYFMALDEKQPYLMHIPGYQSYISGIFNATENDWRNRYIWDINWSTLRKLSIDLKDSPEPLVFEYKNNFMGVNGVNELDTAAMMDYLESIANLQTDKYLKPGEITVYDQATQSTDPQVVINVEQIGDHYSSLRLYPQPEGKQYVPGLLDKTQLVLFQPSIFESIQAKSSDFDLIE